MIISDKIKKIFDIVIDIVFGIILIFIILGIAIGSIQLFITIWKLFAFKGITGQYINIITDVLTLYVLVELSRSLVDYFNTHKIRLTFIVDAAIVFVIREIMIGLFKHEINPEMLYASSALLFVLSALRIGSVLVFQRDREFCSRISALENEERE